MLAKLTGLVCAILIGAAAMSAQASFTSPPPVDLDTIVGRMIHAQHQNAAHARAFTVKRDYQLLDNDRESKAHVVANITFVPPHQKQYQIESARGGLGEKILRDVLTRETEAPKVPGSTAISTDNYEFQLIGTEIVDGRRCYILGLNPKRNDKNLVRGQAWVDAETYNIRKIEGKTAKSPSWWIHDVQILMSFAEIDGMWLRTFTRAVANVRFKGRYEMVSRDLEYLPVQQVVSHRSKRPEILAGAAFNP